MKQLTKKEINIIAGGEGNCQCISNNPLNHFPSSDAEDQEECRFFCCDFYKQFFVGGFKFKGNDYWC